MELLPQQKFTDELKDVFDAAFVPIQTSIDSSRIPGAAFGIVDLKRGRIAGVSGQAAVKPEPRPLGVDTWFDLASLTKALFTTPRILALHESGRLDLDQPVTSVIPDLRQYNVDAWERRITFRDCLGHQTFFQADIALHIYGENPMLLRHFVLQYQWQAVPSVYSCINFILLGIALERIEGKTILQMDPGPGFAFSAPPEQSAATDYCPWRNRILSGEVHDEKSAALQGSGNAGLFGTITSVLDAGEALLRQGVAGDRVVQWQRTPITSKRTYGWEHAHPGWSGGDRACAETIGHTGHTGTGLWVDFKNERAWVLLTNRVHFGRFFDSGVDTLRRAVGNIVCRDEADW